MILNKVELIYLSEHLLRFGRQLVLELGVLVGGFGGSEHSVFGSHNGGLWRSLVDSLLGLGNGSELWSIHGNGFQGKNVLHAQLAQLALCLLIQVS